MTRGKDNIPGWDGSPATWDEYRRAAFAYEETVKYENRYLCGPRLATELSGAAKAAISNKRRGWLSYVDGVERLVQCLRQTMSEPALPEIANQLRQYFKLLRRKSGETMTAFCVRHREEYVRTCKALTRVLREEKSLQHQAPNAWSSSRRSSQSWPTESWSNPYSERANSGGVASEPAEEEAYDDDETEQPEEVSEVDYWQDAWWQEAWDWSDYSWWSYQHHGAGEHPDFDETADEEDYIEILPDTIQGWLLLEKCNLTHIERSLIQSEVRGKFTLAAVENALRSHFTDESVRRRDHEHRDSAMMNMEELDDLAPESEEVDPAYFEEWSEEHFALYQQAKADEHQAWAQIEQGRQTLREARARQYEVRMGRRFYDLTGKKGGGFKGKGKGRQFGPCARCGKGHDTQFCRVKSQPSGDSKNYEATEQSEFVYTTWEKSDADQIPQENNAQAFGQTSNGALNTFEVMRKGYGVLDGGATKTMGSVTAIQHIQDKCRVNQAPGLTKVDLSETPTFGFGNSAQGTCVSTCYLKVPVQEHEMSFKIHALDQGTAPVLISVTTLRRMGAIIDFSKDEAIFSAVNPKKIVPLARSSAGHQLIPLTEDFMQHGESLPREIFSLRSAVFEKLEPDE